MQIEDLERTFEVSSKTGFIPFWEPSEPLDGLFKEWEDLLYQLPTLIRDKLIRNRAGGLELIPREKISFDSEKKWWRAYVVTTYICQAYIWCEGEDGVARVLPRNLAIPWCAVSEHLGMPPVMTHAAGCLYNWQNVLQPESEDIQISASYTGTPDERGFFMIGLWVELEVAKAISLIPTVFDQIRANDAKNLLSSLQGIKEVIHRMTVQISKMRKHCDPLVFNEQFRPFLAGWGPKSVISKGMLYEGVHEEPRQYYGGNAGQSSSLQMFDLLLGVSHEGYEGNFLKEQREHMPPGHRKFLEWLKEQPSLREFIKNSNQKELIEGYNQCIRALVDFRCKHINMVSLYIIVQKGKTPDKVHFEGTGGNQIMPFLKKIRDDGLANFL